MADALGFLPSEIRVAKLPKAVTLVRPRVPVMRINPATG